MGSGAATPATPAAAMTHAATITPIETYQRTADLHLFRAKGDTQKASRKAGNGWKPHAKSTSLKRGSLATKTVSPRPEPKILAGGRQPLSSPRPTSPML